MRGRLPIHFKKKLGSLDPSCHWKFMKIIWRMGNDFSRPLLRLMCGMSDAVVLLRVHIVPIGILTMENWLILVSSVCTIHIATRK